MSEKIYARLLRLYPSHFRETYGDAALQLFRDRARDERGFFLTLRLWLDLLADLAISIPREHRCVQPAFADAFARQHSGGTPSFQILEVESLRFGALVFGAILSLAAFTGCSFLINDAGRTVALTPWGPESQPGSGFARSASGLAPAPPDTIKARVSAVERRRVIDAVIANLKAYYIDPDASKKIAEVLLRHEERGDYTAVTGGAAFADLLTRQMRGVSHDMHLHVLYSEVALPDLRQGSTPGGLAGYRAAMEQQNCTFENAKILPHNIGYLKLDSFPDPSICESAAKAAMASLNDVDAVVFDLRDNRGGDPAMVMLIAAYLFDHPEYMFNPRENTTQRCWTRSPVPGNKLANKPVYVLTSSRTFSGAEHFSYDLKMLKRATLVGETTGGATDVGVFHRIDDHFGMGIRETRTINPYSEPDWAVNGVEPGVKVKAEDALETAKKLAENELLAKHPNPR
jgi:hypothetical protein